MLDGSTRFDLYRRISVRTDSKIVLLIMDGLGGHPHDLHGRSEMEVADTPNLDALTARSATGLSHPVAPGITPGSGPGHLSLFGYDPITYEVGRGVLSALGIDFPMKGGDVAARVNFCTVDEEGKVTDRRAGRIATEVTAGLCEKLAGISVEGAEMFLRPEMDYRAALVLRGKGLDGRLLDSDPQREGVEPLEVKPAAPEAEQTAKLVNEYIGKAREVLRGESPANMILVRGFAQLPDIPSMGELYKLRPACIATYPMYRGVSRLVGMEILDGGTTLENEVEALKKHWKEHDFFFFHVKKTDSAGEDGDFQAKVHVIEAVDRIAPAIRDLGPDVLAICGDHSTPSILKAHSWHPLPFVLWSEYCRPDSVEEFTEEACAHGNLGHIHHTDIMPLLMANALKFLKYGA